MPLKRLLWAEVIREWYGARHPAAPTLLSLTSVGALRPPHLVPESTSIAWLCLSWPCSQSAQLQPPFS